MGRPLWSALVLAAFAVAGLAGAMAVVLWLRGPGADLQPLRSGPHARPEVALTFDVAWGEHQPADVLRALREEDAPATFFVSGPWAATHPQDLRAMVAAGHDIGTLGWTGSRLSRRPPARVRDDLHRASQAVARSAGAPPAWFRPPDGDYDTEVILAARDLGLRVVTWTVDAHDEGVPDADTIVRRVLRTVRPGTIVRLHADDGASATDEAVVLLVQRLRAEGYRLVPLSAWRPR